MTISEKIKEALRQLPTLAMASTGNRPRLTDIYFPSSHVEALNPDVSLVIGNRGMGKTFWTLALADPELRPEIGERYFRRRTNAFDRLDVRLGFADAEGAAGMVSRAILETVPRSFSTELIWRAVIIRALADLTGSVVPSKFRDLVRWVRESPEEQLELFRAADVQLEEQQKTLLVLFDQLDQLAESWDRIQELTQGLLKVALAMKSYKNIKVKLFMRPDQAENKTLFRFADSSKISGGSQVLAWKATDLYGLVFFEIMKTPSGKLALMQLCEGLKLAVDLVHPRLSIPLSLVADHVAQGRVIDALAGEFMGRGSKRGRPYTWLPVHLADGRGEISPRTFLQVFKTAAERPVADSQTAIDFRGLLEGVRQASGVRLAELEEDYPWVSDALEPLRGLLVPCERFDIGARWESARTPSQIEAKYQGAQAPLDLGLAELLGDDPAEVLISNLNEIGVLEERSNGKINVPDIFRVKAGILRKGGVPPQERARL